MMGSTATSPLRTSHNRGNNKSYEYGRAAFIAQCSATFVVGLSSVGIGVMMLSDVVVLGKVLDSKSGSLSLNEEEASWFGSISSLLRPVGSMMGILLLDFCSQWHGLLVSSTLALIHFSLLYYSTTVSTALLASVVEGLSIGFYAPSAMGYLAEFSEPKHRGFLGFSISLVTNLAVFCFSYVASMMEWRTFLAVCAVMPLSSLVLLPSIPASPVWLLSKGRKEEAMKALAWFRGWTHETYVNEELSDLEQYVKKSLEYKQTADAERMALLGNSHDEKKYRLLSLLSSVLEERTLCPLFLMVAFNFVVSIAETIGTTAYTLNFFESLNLPFDTYFLMSAVLLTKTVGVLISVLTLQYTGKRIMTLLAMFLLASASISTGGYINFKDELRMPWIFFGILLVRGFAAAQTDVLCGIIASEMFPVRTRHAGTGLVDASNSICRFLLIKTYFATVHTLGYEWYFTISGAVGMFGCLFLYKYLPETERKSLMEIEDYFLPTPTT